MKLLFVVLGMCVVASPCVWGRMELDAGLRFNVIDYGAIGNGETDDSQVCFSLFLFFYTPNISLGY